MATKDISRSAFDPRKQYASVRMQQGRVMVDDDWNENERIENEDRRRSRVEIIGPAGSPDHGFQVANLRLEAGLVNFDLRAGTFYLGGLRLELHADQSFRLQRDLLQGPSVFPAPTAERFDLVYLEAYQEPVGAVEDEELFEAALGGADTSARQRTYQQVFLEPGVADQDCEDAWTGLVKRWAADGRGQLNDENELVSGATLRVGFLAAGAPDDLCTPNVLGGYLGAENQAIRVQVSQAGRLTWGFDNADPLYRVQAAGDRRTLTLLTDPKDQAHWPLAGQVVEVLPWAAVLPNGQKTAGLQGHLTRLDASYNPDTGQLRLVDPIPTAGFDDWNGRADQADLAGGGVFYYLRVWNRGADLASDPEIAFNPGAPLTLGQTGLQVTLDGTPRLGDYWIIAARPETPNRVVPWELEAGRAPHGVRRYAAPLALIHWQFAGGALAGVEVLDCRITFPPLTRQQTCCSFTVGDGILSHGRFDSLEEAIDHLPAAGGEICLLPGFHRANAVLAGLSNVRISGCRRLTRIAPRPETPAEPVLQVRDSTNILIEDLDLIALEGSAIVASGQEPGLLSGLDIAHTRILAYRNGIQVMQGRAVHLHDNLIRMLDREGGDVAIFLLAEEGLVERNDLGVTPAGVRPPPGDRPPGPDNEPDPDPADPCADFKRLYTDRRAYLVSYARFVWTRPLRPELILRPAAAARPAYQTLGGIQVGSGSEQIRILTNRIRGGAGNGITLGSDLDPADFPSGQAPQEVDPIFRNRDNPIVGRLLGSAQGDERLPGFNLGLTHTTTGATQSVQTNGSGLFFSDVGEGDIRLDLLTPGYRLVKIETFRERDQEKVNVQVRVERIEDDFELADVLAFIYEVAIEGNEISDLELSGIGAPILRPDLLPRLRELMAAGQLKSSGLTLTLSLLLAFGLLTGFVVDLLIRQNRIFGCLRNGLDERLRDLAGRRGQGGISLGLCEDLVIRENRIEDNGPDHLTPVCGVFVSLVQQGEISHNQIYQNGPLNLRAGRMRARQPGVLQPGALQGGLQDGLRGGVVVRLALSRSLAELTAGSSTATLGLTTAGLAAVEAQTQATLASGRHALRVHANLVEQPVGNALNLLALGSVAVTDNSFTTQFSAQMERQAGPDFSGGAVTLRNIGRAQPDGRLPDGNTLFDDNQTFLNNAGRSPIVQVIMSQDDLGFNHNQSQVQVGPELRVNTLLAAPTVRASGNRLEEPVGRGEVNLGTKLGKFKLEAIKVNRFG